jgi:hypothetical protein
MGRKTERKKRKTKTVMDRQLNRGTNRQMSRGIDKESIKTDTARDRQVD